MKEKIETVFRLVLGMFVILLGLSLLISLQYSPPALFAGFIGCFLGGAVLLALGCILILKGIGKL